ncbi:hypothetical protein [Burkholderia vietnamiensis]|uniref:hypothetical protein n=1 Tax=Burkholderia vietnamiensis TaxID=60552 RepID=UPI001FC8B670|nr:hypothetical protein [Burkholderia vietnamiensis]
MVLLFFCISGVLGAIDRHPSITTRENEPEATRSLESDARLFAQAIEPFPGALVVIANDWPLLYDLEFLRQEFALLGPRIVNSVKILGGTKEESILKFMSSRSEPYVVVTSSDFEFSEGTMGIRAFFAQFQVRESDAALLVQVATRGYEPAGGAAYSKVAGGAHFHIHLSWAPKFAGVVVSLVSDDAEVFHHIAEGRFSPPPPWTVFPHLDPLGLGALQGDVAYWWRQFWSPFWNSLSPVERDTYLTSNSASADWADCVRLHSM